VARPPTHAELVQVHDDREAVQGRIDELPVIDLHAPEWSVNTARRLAGLSEPRARFVATTLLRGAGVGPVGLLLAIALSGWKSRAAVPTLLLGAAALALLAKRINFGGMPIWPRLLFIVVVAFLAGLAGLSLRRNWAALTALAVLTSGLAAWGSAIGVCDNLYDAWQGTARHVLEAGAEVPDGDLSQHFWVSAALAALADESRSLAVGLSKEVMDSTAGGSGFSFVDMAANCAGIRMAAVATRNSRSAHHIQTRIRRGVEVSDVLPSIRGLPEAITADQLQADYGGLSSAETKRLLGEIDRRICAS
jgi:uncharacterized protein YfiM (DUF2279 family)